jgi:hypothetical protein
VFLLLRLPPPDSGPPRVSRVSSRRLPAQDSSGAVTCCLGSSTHHLTQGSSGAATCPVDGLFKLQAIKQIFSDNSVIMIFIGVCVRVSAKALRNKGCSACLQGMQQTVH